MAAPACMCVCSSESLWVCGCLCVPTPPPALCPVPCGCLQAAQQTAKLQGLYDAARRERVVSETQLQVSTRLRLRPPRKSAQWLRVVPRPLQGDPCRAPLALTVH